MNKSALLLIVLLAGGCGYSQTDAELIGQVKKIVHVNPIFCPEREEVDISLGVLRNGVGSMSTQDQWMRVMNRESLGLLKRAAETGELVKIKYAVRRATICFSDHNLHWVEIVH